nr:reverse transcriptase domain-containing protein [Tanacetum cinerariifolium]
MSTNEQTPLSQPTSAVRNTLGREQAPQNLVRPVSDEDLREYCDKNIHQILPIIAEKLHQKNVQQEKLKAVKVRLNFKEAFQYSESETLNIKRNLKERLGHRYSRTRSGSPKPRHGRSKSPREKGSKRRTVFKRLEKGTQKAATKVLALKKQKLLPRNIVTKESIHEERKQCHKVKEVQEGTGSQNQRSKSRVWRTTCPNHGEDPEDHLKIFQAAAKTKRWAMPTWCLMFNSTLTRNDRDEEVGHTTDECMHLKRQIEEMLNVGNLSHLIKELKQNHKKDQAKIAKKEETSGKDKPLAILMVQPWQRIARKMITQTFSPESVISFPTPGEEDGTEGPMIIEAEMGGHCMHRIYVDGGSSLKILYEHCFSKFRSKIKNQLIPANTPLVRFSGEIIWPLGQISLLVKIGNEEHSTTAWMNFMVVRSPSPYNGIIGRPGSSMIIPLECLMVSEPGVPRSAINQVKEEKIQVVIHPEYLEQIVAIGSTLTGEEQKELCGLLRRHLDVFAWKPADMTGIYVQINEKSLPFFKTLKKCTKKSNFQWTPEAERAFKEIKQSIAELSMLTTPKEKEELIMYLEAAKEAISAVLMTERDGKQVPFYFMSRALQGPEINNTLMEKPILAIVNAREHDIKYRPRTSVKGQILADFIVERPEDDAPDTPMEDREELPDPWILFTD